MDLRDADIARRAAIVRTRRLLLGTAAAATLGALPGVSRAKAAKADFFYQEKPKDGKSCASCRLFTAGESGRGKCALVDGEISANGWCMAYSARGS